MRTIPCFFYRDGEHFTLPPEFSAAPPNPCAFVVAGEGGSVMPDPRWFTPVSDPAKAEVFLFPWDIGQYIDAGASAVIWRVIAALPYLSGRENRHIVCDDGDFTQPPPLPVALFKISVTKAIAAACVSMPYALPAHMAHEAPSFDWSQIRYDTSFVGNITNAARPAAVASIKKQAPELRFFADVDNSFVVRDGYFFNTRVSGDPAKTARRQELFRASLKESLTVLCPPGVGPHSIRLYETMSMGRVPVLFGDDAVYPLAKLVGYEDFCLVIPHDEIMNTGNILKAWLAAKGEETLHEMGVAACRAWNRYLVPEKVHGFLLAEARTRFWG
ncbi:glycosyltransferase family 47 protein [Desulfovibrio sp. OttesenSCG-928-O18]|nr:glycosyltransferase family 47 protein [Desulfovibrio sp. OttesenSCG-928-O18]